MDMNDPAGAAPSPQNLPDSDPQETREWLDALDAVIEHEGPVRAQYLLEQLVARARNTGAYIPYNANTAYVNTIPADREERSPGDPESIHLTQFPEPGFPTAGITDAQRERAAALFASDRIDLGKLRTFEGQVDVVWLRTEPLAGEIASLMDRAADVHNLLELAEANKVVVKPV